MDSSATAVKVVIDNRIALFYREAIAAMILAIADGSLVEIRVVPDFWVGSSCLLRVKFECVSVTHSYSRLFSIHYRDQKPFLRPYCPEAEEVVLVS